MSSNNEKGRITLDQIEARMVDSSIITKMITGYFKQSETKDSDSQIHYGRDITISCVDSRVPPALIVGQPDAQAYAVQTVANIAPELDPSRSYSDQHLEVTAALEYAVSYRDTKNIIVLGHTDCGGAHARLLRNADLPYINKWMDHVHLENESPQKLIESIRADAFLFSAAHRKTENDCLKTSIKNIEKMPFIADAIKNGKLTLTGITCDLHNQAINIQCSESNVSQLVTSIIERFSIFRKDVWGPDGPMHDLVKHGQNPKSLIITGISPHVAPENVFGIEPGDALIHRRLGGHYHHENTPDGLAATMEFAVQAKKVPSLILVANRKDVNMGYAKGNMEKFPLVTSFMEKCTPEMREMRNSGMAPDKIHEEALRHTYFNTLKHPAVKSAVEAGKLSLAALFVDHEKHTLEYYDPQKDEFLMIDRPEV